METLSYRCRPPLGPLGAEGCWPSKHRSPKQSAGLLVDMSNAPAISSGYSTPPTLEPTAADRQTNPRQTPRDHRPHALPQNHRHHDGGMSGPLTDRAATNQGSGVASSRVANSEQVANLLRRWNRCWRLVRRRAANRWCDPGKAGARAGTRGRRSALRPISTAPRVPPAFPKAGPTCSRV